MIDDNRANVDVNDLEAQADIRQLLIQIIDHLRLMRSGEDFCTDAELARRWRVSEKTARLAIRGFGKSGRFPERDSLMGHKRYWPAVVQFMRARYGLVEHGQGYPTPPDGEEMSQAQLQELQRRRRRGRF